MKPILATDMIRETSARNSRSFTQNRFNLLGNNSEEVRDRSPSVKRKQPDSTRSYANVAKKGTGTANSFQNPLFLSISDSEGLERIDKSIAVVTSLCDKISESISCITDPVTVKIFHDICGALTALSDAQFEIAQVVKSGKTTGYSAAPHLSSNLGNTGSLSNNLGSMSGNSGSQAGLQFLNLGNIGNLAKNKSFRPVAYSHMRKVSVSSSLRDSAQNMATSEAGDEGDSVSQVGESVPTHIKKFRDQVKDAERSTLVFNLDMGKTPLMNQQTISKKATSALLSMAAAAEGKFTSTPSQEAVEAIDDILSMSKNMVFFGTSTRTYSHPKDKKSGSFCTLPVKYTFKDKDTRIMAEKVLRSTCKVNCSTPYTPVLRQCIKQAIESGKLVRPEDFVRVTVDTVSPSLRISWRAKDSKKWTHHVGNIPLPSQVFDPLCKKLPDDLVLQNLPGSGDMEKGDDISNTTTRFVVETPIRPLLTQEEMDESELILAGASSSQSPLSRFNLLSGGSSTASQKKNTRSSSRSKNDGQ